MNDNLLQIIITAILSSGVVAGIFSYINKRSKSPESQNDLARIGNEFAAQLLEQAQSERKELRLSIVELEKSNDLKQTTIDRLNAIMDKKNAQIAELEALQRTTAHKLQRGEPITLRDIFGIAAPNIQLNLVDDLP